MNNIANTDADDLEMLTYGGAHLIFKANPHREGSQKHILYENVRNCKTISDAKAMGATQWDLRDWLKKKSIDFERVVQHDSDYAITKKEFMSLAIRKKISSVKRSLYFE